MNLLFLCDTYPPNIGGSEQLMRRCARMSQGLGHAVVVLCPSSDAPPEVERAFDAAEPYVIQRSRTWRRLFHMGGSRNAGVSRIARASVIFHVFSLVRRMREVDAIVVGHVVPGGNVAAAMKRLRGIPFITTIYGEEFAVYARGPRTRQMMLAALRASDVIRCITHQTAADVAQLDPCLGEHTIAVHPPAELDVARNVSEEEVDETRETLGLTGGLALLTVGRLVPRKGVDLTLRAMAMLTRDMPQLRYLVVGTGPHQHALHEAANELGIADRVTFTGAVDDLTPFYHACDIFVMPNRVMPDGEQEGYGLVFLEAGLAGKPVIGGRTGGAAEAVLDGKTGILVDPYDPAALAAAIRSLASDPALRARMGEAGRRHALSISSPEAARENWRKVLERLPVT